MNIAGFESTEDLLKEYDLPFAPTRLVRERKEVKDVAEGVGFPLVMKISSKEHLHRTELGGVIVGVKNEEEAENAFDRLSDIEDIEGVLIQKQIKGVELVIGGKRDPSFGPVVMFGLGGVFVEVMKDISFRLAPLIKEDALSMMEELKGREILDGFRGNPPVDRNGLAEILVNTSLMMEKEGIAELDLNPVIAGEELLICDAKIVRS